MNWPFACVCIACALSLPLMFWAIAWAERRMPEKGARDGQRINNEAEGVNRQNTWTETQAKFWTGAAKFKNPPPCPVPGCKIAKAHSHVDAFLDKLRGGK